MSEQNLDTEVVKGISSSPLLPFEGSDIVFSKSSPEGFSKVAPWASSVSRYISWEGAEEVSKVEPGVFAVPRRTVGKVGHTLQNGVRWA